MFPKQMLSGRSIGLALLVLMLSSTLLLAQTSLFARTIPVATTVAPEQMAALGLNDHGEYLVVWQVDAGAGNIDIWARRARLTPDFAWLGAAFAVANSPKPEQNAAISYNQRDNEFLVVYEYVDAPDDYDIRAQRIDAASGAATPLIGSALAVAVTTGSEYHPDATYLCATNQYLVVYEMDENIWARRVARRQQGDFVGDEFVVAATQDAETHPAVAAARFEAYFLVAYTSAFGQGDDDIRAQRVRGRANGSENLLNASFVLADTTYQETAPALVYSPWARAFVAVWQQRAGSNDDVHGGWIDAGNFTNQPLIGPPFAISTHSTAAERAPAVDADARTGDIAVALTWGSNTQSWQRPAQIWLNRDPRATQRIIQALQVLPERQFMASDTTVRLLPGSGKFIQGYTAQWGTSPTANTDAYLLTNSHWPLFLPVIWR